MIHHSFKMGTLKSILMATHRGGGVHMASFDLQEAYLHVAFLPAHCQFLRFCYGRCHYQFSALPFGLTSAPRAFIKVLIVLVARLLRQGVAVFPFLEDLLIAARSHSRAATHLLQTVNCLSQHGFLINFEKSHYNPTQTIEHLGALINSSTHSVSLSQEHHLRIKDLALTVLQTPRRSIQVLSNLLGLLTSSYDIIP